MVKQFIHNIIRIYYTGKVKNTAAECGEGLRVNRKSFVNGHTYLGSYVNFNGMSIIGDGVVRIGSHFHSGGGCLIITQNHNYDNGNKIPYDETYIFKETSIGDNVWMGERVIVLPGVHIGEGVVIQAGSTVVSDTPDCAIIGGAPAKIIKYRNKEHYYKLKEEEKFL